MDGRTDFDETEFAEIENELESELLLEAEKSNSDAQYQLAIYRWQKLSTLIMDPPFQDPDAKIVAAGRLRLVREEVYPWLEKASKQNHPNACRELATLLFQELILNGMLNQTEPNHKITPFVLRQLYQENLKLFQEIISLYQKSYANDSYSLSMLRQLYSFSGKEEDIKKAFGLVKQLIQNNCMEAHLDMAWLIVLAREINYSTDSAKKEIEKMEKGFNEKEYLFFNYRLLCHVETMKELKLLNNQAGQMRVKELLENYAQGEPMQGTPMVPTKFKNHLTIQRFIEEIMSKISLLGIVLREESGSDVIPFFKASNLTNKESKAESVAEPTQIKTSIIVSDEKEKVEIWGKQVVFHM